SAAADPRGAGGLDQDAAYDRAGARGVRLHHPRLAAGDARERCARAGARERRRGVGGEGPGHAEGRGAARARPALAHRRAPPRHGGEQRRSCVGRLPLLPALLRLLSPAAAPGGAGVTRQSRGVLWTLQATILGMPLFLGGRQTLGLVAAWLAIAVLLVITLQARRRAGHPTAPGAGVLAAFVALGLLTALPLPPAVLERLAPATAELYRDVLPG